MGRPCLRTGQGGVGWGGGPAQDKGWGGRGPQSQELPPTKAWKGGAPGDSCFLVGAGWSPGPPSVAQGPPSDQEIVLWDDAGAGCQGQDKGAGEVRLRCLCFSWGCQLPPIYSPPPTQARKRSARTPAGPNTPHPHNKQMLEGTPPHRLAGLLGQGEASKSDSKGPLGWPSPPSGSPLPLEAVSCQT